MSASRRDFIKRIGAGLAGAGVASSELACAAGAVAGDSDLLLEPNPDHVEPAPLGVDRLPLAWHQRATQRLKDRVANMGVDAILLGTDQNQVYFTGCFRRSGERSTWVLFPVEEADTVYWYSPGIDRDLIDAWWVTENEYYFGYPHAEGGFPVNTTRNESAASISRQGRSAAASICSSVDHVASISTVRRIARTSRPTEAKNSSRKPKRSEATSCTCSGS